METNEYELVVSEGKKPIHEIALAAIFFTISFYLLGCTLWSLFWDNNLWDFIVNFYRTIGIGLFCFGTGLKFATAKTILIDTDKDLLISRYHIGPFSYNITSAVPVLEYVAVFLNVKSYYEVNLWYKGNKHYKMYVFEEKNQAFQFAQKVSQKLKLDLLDATVKGNSRWIDYQLDTE